MNVPRKQVEYELVSWGLKYYEPTNAINTNIDPWDLHAPSPNSCWKELKFDNKEEKGNWIQLQKLEKMAPEISSLHPTKGWKEGGVGWGGGKRELNLIF